MQRGTQATDAPEKGGLEGGEKEAEAVATLLDCEEQLRLEVVAEDGRAAAAALHDALDQRGFVSWMREGEREYGSVRRNTFQLCG